MREVSRLWRYCNFRIDTEYPQRNSFDVSKSLLDPSLLFESSPSESVPARSDWLRWSDGAYPLTVDLFGKRISLVSENPGESN